MCVFMRYRCVCVCLYYVPFCEVEVMCTCVLLRDVYAALHEVCTLPWCVYVCTCLRGVWLCACVYIGLGGVGPAIYIGKVVNMNYCCSILFDPSDSPSNARVPVWQPFGPNAVVGQAYCCVQELCPGGQGWFGTSL